jgi:hypothetical protein
VAIDFVPILPETVHTGVDKSLPPFRAYFQFTTIHYNISTSATILQGLFAKFSRPEAIFSVKGKNYPGFDAGLSSKTVIANRRRADAHIGPPENVNIFRISAGNNYFIAFGKVLLRCKTTGAMWASPPTNKFSNSNLSFQSMALAYRGSFLKK